MKDTKSLETEIVAFYVWILRSLHKYLKNLKASCAASLDGIQAEHLKYATDTDNSSMDIYVTLSCTWSLCINKQKKHKHGSVCSLGARY